MFLGLFLLIIDGIQATRASVVEVLKASSHVEKRLVLEQTRQLQDDLEKGFCHAGHRSPSVTMPTPKVLVIAGSDSSGGA